VVRDKCVIYKAFGIYRADDFLMLEQTTVGLIIQFGDGVELLLHGYETSCGSAGAGLLCSFIVFMIDLMPRNGIITQSGRLFSS